MKRFAIALTLALFGMAAISFVPDVRAKELEKQNIKAAELAKLLNSVKNEISTCVDAKGKAAPCKGLIFFWGVAGTESACNDACMDCGADHGHYDQSGTGGTWCRCHPD